MSDTLKEEIAEQAVAPPASPAVPIAQPTMVVNPSQIPDQVKLILAALGLAITGTVTVVGMLRRGELVDLITFAKGNDGQAYISAVGFIAIMLWRMWEVRRAKAVGNTLVANVDDKIAVFKGTDPTAGGGAAETVDTLAAARARRIRLVQMPVDPTLTAPSQAFVTARPPTDQSEEGRS